MIECVTSLNIEPIIRFAQNVLMILGGFALTGITLFLLYSHKNINVFIKQNDKLIDKFPLVTPDFIAKTTREQNIENNQEIHEINKRIEAIEEAVRLHAKNLMELKDG